MGKHFAKDKRFVPKIKFVEKIGYDGQFFFYAAQDPFGRKGAARNMDSPSYRYQRMFFPLLLNLLYGGDKDSIAHWMAGLNLAAVFGTFLVMYFPGPAHGRRLALDHILFLQLRPVQTDFLRALRTGGQFSLGPSACTWWCLGSFPGPSWPCRPWS